MSDLIETYSIVVPDRILPRHTLGECCYMGDPLDLRADDVYISWLVEEGSHVRRFEVICEGLVGLHIIEFESPADGILVSKEVSEDSAVRAGDVLGVVELTD